MSDTSSALDTTIGTAIRDARFSRGLTQDDLAARLGVTRATIASYETGRRKIPAGKLIQIAHLCGKPLTFFDAPQQPDSAPSLAPSPSSQSDPQHAAVAAIVNTLQAHPEFTPFVLEFLETLVHEQVAGVV
jgi:transcriptional regulator with XRE-family HTH domain